MKLYKFLVQAILSVVAICLLFYFLVPSSLHVEVHEVGNGYGYSVIKKNKTLIKQDFIPVIQQHKTFCTFEEAQSIGNLIKQKIKDNVSPRITLGELKENNISFLCN